MARVWKAVQMTGEKPKLTHKQQVFISEYLKSFNATAAAIAAGYSEKTARQIGAENLTKPDLKAEIQSRLDEVHMGADEALKLTADIARGDITEFITGFGNIDIDLLRKSGKGRLIKKIKQKTVTKIGKGESDEDTEILETEIELYPADAAQERILKIHGKFKESIDVSGRYELVVKYADTNDKPTPPTSEAD